MMTTRLSAAVCLSALLILSFVGCGGGNQQQTTSMSTVKVSLSDPATCSAPQGPFTHVYVTVSDVLAHTSATASDSDAGWVDLTPSLKSAPKQVDLLGQADTSCFLAQLGSTSQLQPGTYQQIRVVLADTGTGLSTSACGNAGMNCVVLSSDPNNPKRLQLSSESQTGIKIPSGQIAGGKFQIAAGETKDLNIDFNACASILLQGNGQYRLKPVLHAGEVNTNSTSINGTIVDSVTSQPLVGGTVLVALEQVDTTGVEHVIMETKADANGGFTFCPVPPGTYDVVAVGFDGSSKSYAATATLAVSPGTALGKIPLVAVPGTNPALATINGTVTTVNSSSAATAADVTISAEQSIPASGGTALIVVPLLQQMSSTLNLSTAAGGSCPAGTDCATYSIGVPAANPNVGTFNSTGTAYTQDTTSAAGYTVGAAAFVPGSGGTADCSPSSTSINQDSSGNPLKVTAAGSVTAATLTFTGCQ